MISIDASAASVKSLLAATQLNVGLIALLVLAVRKAAKPAWTVTSLRVFFLLALVTPIEHLDSHIRPIATRWIAEEWLVLIWTAVLVLPILAAAMLLLGRDGWYRGFRRLVSILVPAGVLFPITAILAIIYQPPRTVTVPPAPAERTAEGRVVWIVFDELDFEAAFRLRPATVEMKETDRLRGGSFFALEATAPALDTMESMTSYLIGLPVEKFEGTAPSFEARLKDGRTIRLPEAATVFSAARSLGFDTFVAGWWLPYCQMLAPHLSGCEEMTMVKIRPSTVAEAWRSQWHMFFAESWIATRFTEAGLALGPMAGFQRDQLLIYQSTLQAATAMVTDPGPRLVLLHFPVPHPIGIYDRHEDRLALRPTLNSLDNLELVDLTIGRLRASMEAAGVWENTTLIVTSDHPLRPENWKKYATWSEEEQELTSNRRKRLIPFLIKPSRSSTPLEYSQPFQAIRTSSIVEAFLRGDLRTVADVANFLSRRDESTPAGALRLQQNR